MALHSYPVSVETFVSDPRYLGINALDEGVLEALAELNNPEEPTREYRVRLFTRYTGAVLTGAIGTGNRARFSQRSWPTSIRPLTAAAKTERSLTAWAAAEACSRTICRSR